MKRVLSTYRFINQQLSSTLLAEIARAGISSVEIFCASSHFTYGAPQTVRELADSLAGNGVELHSLHSPTERNLAEGRDSGASISIADTERIRRIDAVDEVKRALEVAERIPFRYLIQHLGHSRETFDPRKMDAAFSSLELLTVFAKARGVTIALENTPSELGSPDALRQFVKETHLRDLRFCFDIGHAHLEPGVGPAFEAMRDLVVTTHIHDNHGEKDEHLLPWNGTIDWNAALTMLEGAPQPLPIVLELKEQSAGTPSLVEAQAAFDKIEKHFEDGHAEATSH